MTPGQDLEITGPKIKATMNHLFCMDPLEPGSSESDLTLRPPCKKLAL